MKKINRFDSQLYARHLLGMQSFLLWVEAWRELSPIQEVDHVFKLPALVSQRFAMGWPLGRQYGKWPFLALQKEERDIFQLLSLNRVVLLHEFRSLILVTNRILGNNEELIDIPAFGVAIEIDESAKLDALKTNRIECRGIWFDEEGCHVDRHVFADLPLKKAVLWQTILDKEEMAAERSASDWIKEKMNESNRWVNPGYQGGTLSVSDEFKKLVEPFDPSKVPQVRE